MVLSRNGARQYFIPTKTAVRPARDVIRHNSRLLDVNTMVDLSALNKRDKSNLSPRRVVPFCPARAVLGLFQEEKP